MNTYGFYIKDPTLIDYLNLSKQLNLLQCPVLKELNNLLPTRMVYKETIILQYQILKN